MDHDRSSRAPSAAGPLDEVRFEAEVFYWRGPAPYYFVAVPDDFAQEVHAEADVLTYGWGMIPVEVRLGASEFSTAMFAKDGGYVVPLRKAVRDAEHLDDGDVVRLRVRLVRR